MKHTFFLLILILLIPVSLMAQRNAKGAHHGAKPAQYEQVQKQNFEEYIHNKCQMVIRELNLSTLDSSRFEPVYHQLQMEKMDLYRKYGGTRRVRQAMEQGKPVADTTLLRIVNNGAKLQVEDALLEQRYITRFSRILTPQQLFRLQQAEQKFKTETMRRGKPAQK